jgi:hypothetical protein
MNYCHGTKCLMVLCGYDLSRLDAGELITLIITKVSLIIFNVDLAALLGMFYSEMSVHFNILHPRGTRRSFKAAR